MNGIPSWARVEDVPPAPCAELVRALAAGEAPPFMAVGVRWLLAHCDDGVVWGRREKQGSWSLSTGIFPGVSPRLRAESLIELRLFGPEAEVLVWRTAEGHRGRVLSDEESSPGLGFDRPMDREALILGDRVLGSSRGFTLLGDASGRRHAIPCPVEEKDVRAGRVHLSVRDYLSVDEEIGSVRVSASRLVDLVNRGEDA